MARAQVASAIHLVVQIGRFVEDGSRRITRITEACGLDENNQYRTRDLFISRLKGKTPEGRLMADLELTGQQPTFAAEVREQGFLERVKLSQALWET